MSAINVVPGMSSEYENQALQSLVKALLRGFVDGLINIDEKVASSKQQTQF